MILEIFLYVLTLLAARGRKQQSMFPPSHAQELLPCVSARGVSSWSLGMLEQHQASGCLRRPQPKSFCKQGRVVCFGPKSCVLCGPKGRAWPCCVIPTLYLAGRAEGSGLRLSKQERSWEISKTTAERSFSTQSLIYYCNERCILRQEGGKITGRIPRRRGQTCSQRELGKETLCKLISFD